MALQAAKRSDILIVKGTELRQVIEITDEDGNAVDVSGYAGAAAMKVYLTDADAAIEAEITIPYSGSNHMLAVWTAADSATLANRRHFYDAVVTAPGGDPEPVQWGEVEVRPGVSI